MYIDMNKGTDERRLKLPQRDCLQPSTERIRLCSSTPDGGKERLARTGHLSRNSIPDRDSHRIEWSDELVDKKHISKDAVAEAMAADDRDLPAIVLGSLGHIPKD